ncbi:MltR family transcriptional regulator [Vibrio diabolicus]|uniref:MltR family transcriptional regulator n=1 Tax=Vibrio harveyi group TaxID=717610 RepID=UPI001BD5FD08|nr:hypothetical protein [Vibrio alginolyticus]
MKSYKEVTEIIKGESDRGAVLIAAAMVELELENLLKAKLVDTDKKKDPIFEHNGPLGNFSSKIEMAYRLGLITQKQNLMFNTFRKLRNQFAHSSVSLSLENDAIKDQLEAVFNHNSDIKDLFVTAVQATAESHDLPNEIINQDLKSGRYMLNMVFSLEILALHFAQDKVIKIERKDG